MINFLVEAGTCSSPELAGTIFITKKIFDLIELLAPIVLIVMLVINILRFSMDPEDKKGFPRIKNSVMACVFIFLVPVITNTVMGIAGSDFSISECWNNSEKVSNNIGYISPDDKKASSILIDPSEYQNGTPSTSNKKNKED